MKKHTCHLDFHQRSHYVTNGQEGSKVVQQPEGEAARQPEGEGVRQAKFFQPTQLIPNLIRDRSGRLSITHDVISVQDERKTSCSQEIIVKNPVLHIEQGDLSKQRQFKHVHLKTARVSMLSRLMIEQGDLLLTQHKELGSSDRTGKPVKLSEDIRVKHVHDGTGEPVKSSASTHIVKEQFVPAEHRDIASFILTRTTSSTLQPTRRTLTSTFQE